MLTDILYDRSKALEYAERWAFFRNPKYYNFDPLGGDCTNFISQCVFAGSGVMNYTRIFGWYFIKLTHRAPAWSGVEFLYKFLVNNTGEGPYAKESGLEDMRIGDIIQLGNAKSHYYHSLFVCGFDNGEILISTHTLDRFAYPLSNYYYQNIRYLHIEGVRKRV
ncbi:MAG: amidase [Clostridia bacterium]|nr:amidase [Clostridia bacterium]